MTSWKDTVNVVIAIALLSFIGLSLFRIGAFLVESYGGF